MAYCNIDVACCGIQEIANIESNRGDNEQILTEVCEGRFEEKGEGDCAFYFFSDINDCEYAISLKKYIISQSLGVIIATNKKKNPNSGNYLKMWIWSINQGQLKKWAKDHDCYNRYD